MTSTNISTTQALVEANQGMVVSLAKAIHRKLPAQFAMEDLVAYGQLGLAEAAKSYEEGHGASFSTFAYYRIRGAIYDGISKMSWNSYAARIQAKYQRLANEAIAASGMSPPSESTKEENANWVAGATENLAMVYLASHGDETRDALSGMADPHAQAPDGRLEREEVQQLVTKMLDSLSPQEQRLMRLTYFEGMTLKEAGESMGRSKSWASRLHHATLERLSRWLRQAE